MKIASKLFLGLVLTVFLMAPTVSFAQSSSTSLNNMSQAELQTLIQKLSAQLTLLIANQNELAKIPANHKSNSSMILVSPNGGEVLQKGKTYDIRWSSYNIPTVKMFLMSESQAIQYSMMNLPTKAIPNTGSHSWTVPVGLPESNDYTITIVDGAVVGGAPIGTFDRSDTNFTISLDGSAVAKAPVSTSGGNSINLSIPIPSTAKLIKGDFDLNNKVNSIDLGMMVSVMGKCTVGQKCYADLNNDAWVNQADVDILLKNWTK